MAHGYSSESTGWELSNEYQHDRVKMVIKNISTFVLWTNAASALEGFKVALMSKDDWSIGHYSIGIGIRWWYGRDQ